MARARELRTQTHTQVDTLRDNLAELERGLPTLKGMGQRAVELLHRLDAVHDDVTRLQEQGIDLRSEHTRLETIAERLRGDGISVLVREIARTAGWDAIRASVAPERDRWWWYLDEELAELRRSTLRRRLLRGGIILLAALLLYGAYQQFLAPSPETQQKITLMQRADQHIEAGDLEQAIARYEEAAAVDPDDPEVQLWLGVLYDQAGQRGAAIEALQSARRSAPSMLNYFLFRSRIYLQLGLLEEAAGDILAALSLDPQSSQGLFLLGDLLERQGNYLEAMDIFQVVSLEAEDPALQVLSKVRYGMLLEAGPRLEMDTITPTVQGGAR
jgi:cytochrome c-type biogenesis protein CcmH/NrfG